MRLTVSNKLEVMFREGSFLVGASSSLIALLALVVKVSDAEYAPEEVLIAAALVVCGLALAYHSIDKHKLLWALAADASLVTGSLEASHTTAKEIDGTTFYRVAYSYRFEGLDYIHCVETSALDKYGTQELIFIQRLRPENAVFATDLPSVVRDKLQLATSNQPHAR
jgi:hypothetical protein